MHQTTNDNINSVGIAGSKSDNMYMINEKIDGDKTYYTIDINSVKKKF